VDGATIAAVVSIASVLVTGGFGVWASLIAAREKRAADERTASGGDQQRLLENLWNLIKQKSEEIESIREHLRERETALATAEQEVDALRRAAQESGLDRRLSDVQAVVWARQAVERIQVYRARMEAEIAELREEVMALDSACQRLRARLRHHRLESGETPGRHLLGDGSEDEDAREDEG
jgi:exonuclease VII large subunit